VKELLCSQKRYEIQKEYNSRFHLILGQQPGYDPKPYPDSTLSKKWFHNIEGSGEKRSRINTQDDAIFFYLSICGLFNGAVSSSDLTASSVRVISEHLVGNDVDGSDCSLI
jgi:hypothetical protein